jgi:hypothetical protein
MLLARFSHDLLPENRASARASASLPLVGDRRDIGAARGRRHDRGDRAELAPQQPPAPQPG